MYILLSVLASTFIFILFKVLGTYKIDTSKAIVINYLTACLFGFFIHPKPIDIADIATEKWFYGAILLGFLFIIVFNVMAITAQKNGLSVASVASKMSLVIPVVSGILIYGEALNSTLIIGIVLALLSVYLTASKSNTATNLRQNLMFPIFLFVGTGVIDTSIKFIQVSSLAKDDISIFSASIFCFAALFGLLQLIIKKHIAIDIKTVIGGILLGLVNFSSLYFIIKSLQLENWSSATVFTLNNVGIVMLSTLVGKFIFKEHLLKKNWIGIAIAISSITIITLAE